jgi:hypothetical protein
LPRPALLRNPRGPIHGVGKQIRLMLFAISKSSIYWERRFSDLARRFNARSFPKNQAREVT